MHGKGTYYHSNGDIYIGESKEGTRTGYGVVHYAHGERYEGNLVDGNKILFL